MIDYKPKSQYQPGYLAGVIIGALFVAALWFFVSAKGF